jgi:hypothetical protein
MKDVLEVGHSMFIPNSGQSEHFDNRGRIGATIATVVSPAARNDCGSPSGLPQLFCLEAIA